MEIKQSNTESYKNIINTHEDDFRLIKEFNEGKEEAFRNLVLKHSDKVRNLVFLTLSNPDNIDDIFQEVFISVYHKLKTFRFESQFTTWLYRITVNKCKDFLRKKKTRSIFTPIQDEHHDTISRSPSETTDIPALVQRVIAKLPDNLKIPLIMRDIDGLSYKEIADKLQLEVGTIKSRIFRARESLKILLKPYEKELF